jgi:hypothetical protein
MSQKSSALITALMTFVLPVTPAQADVTAHYGFSNSDPTIGPPVDLEMSVEVKDERDFRMQLPGVPSYIVAKGGTVYLVMGESGRQRTMHMEDVDAVLLENARKQGSVDYLQAAQKEFEHLEWRQTESSSVNGRSGIGFGLTTKDGPAPEGAFFVVSNDPELRPLADPFLALAADKSSLFALLVPGISYPGTSPIFERGGPLRIGPLELDQVNFDAINEARFALPSEPMTRDEIRKSKILFEARSPATP